MDKHTPIIIAEYLIKPTFVAKSFNVKLKANRKLQVIYESEFFKIVYHGYEGKVLVELDHENLHIAITQLREILDAKKLELKHKTDYLLKISKWEFITKDEVLLLESLEFKKEGLSWILKK